MNRDAFDEECDCFQQAYWLSAQRDISGLEQLKKRVQDGKQKLILTNRGYLALTNLIDELIDLVKKGFGVHEQTAKANASEAEEGDLQGTGENGEA